MESINFKNGILIQSNEAYNLYHLFFSDLSEFIMATPTTYAKKYQMIIYFNNINFKAEHINPDDIITPKIGKNLNKLYENYPNAICVIPTISKREFDEILDENDDKSYARLMARLKKVMNYAYWSIKNNLIFEDTMDVLEQISIIKQSEEDVKFFWWLELQGIKTYKQISIEKPKMELYVPTTKEEKVKKEPEINPTPPPRRHDMSRTKKRPRGDGVHSTGYSNMAFMIMVLTISLLMGLGLAILILK